MRHGASHLSSRRAVSELVDEDGGKENEARDELQEKPVKARETRQHHDYGAVKDQ